MVVAEALEYDRVDEGGMYSYLKKRVSKAVPAAQLSGVLSTIISASKAT